MTRWSASIFEEHKSSLERVQARHILIRVKGSRVPLRPGEQDLTDDQAKAKADEVYKRLKAGGDFAKIAREESDDTGSGADGGDLGSFGHGRMVMPFEQTAFSLKEGEISQPVRTPFGWHVIQVEHRFDTPEKLAEQIRASLGPKKTEDLIADLKKSRKTEIDTSFFGPPPPPEPASPISPARRRLRRHRRSRRENVMGSYCVAIRIRPPLRIRRGAAMVVPCRSDITCAALPRRGGRLSYRAWRENMLSALCGAMRNRAFALWDRNDGEALVHFPRLCPNRQGEDTGQGKACGKEDECGAGGVEVAFQVADEVYAQKTA